MELKDYVAVIRKRLWLILLLVVVSTIVTFVYTNQQYQPIYEAATKLIVNKTLDDSVVGIEQMDYGALNVNIELINTYREIIRTPAIMDKVIQRYPELDVSSESLIDRVQIFALNNTQVMAIYVQDYSYEQAARIVNAVSEVFKSEIPNIMKVDNIMILNTADETDPNPQPINFKSNQAIVLAVAISLIFGVGIAFLLEFLDDSVKTENDVQQVFGRPVLAIVEPPKPKKPQSFSRKPFRREAGEIVANRH
ncbi:Wzz/FepE/Etk N-terminal domain-containing protein [Cohnella lubricantis]|uniref:Lipopolysaccharide biosynthesis protein n=1 Tax=Cohnella lubricantis TaxID=2163172 RepID=A0A841TC68_9BACL|nr:Wzz/FepE/Etk N-terminal domain-containing protein [Cohnella lubricantis]MBB6676830.1 lipopolysaccharide biosynthesis protein [Cohnella lubricantis]MBP2119409.1 capsular polysaccharide biosynthesis protein [Cohnella lubricantis]